MRFIVDAHHFLLSFNYKEINWRSWKTWAVIGVIAVVLFAIGRAFFSGEVASEPLPEKTREVTLASVGALTSNSAPLPVIGEVTSATEADIRAEAGGRITGVYAKLGDFVGAGKILAETENRSQRAALLQAEGAFDAAKASLSKVQGGTRNEQLAVLEAGYESAKGGAVTTLLSAYASVDSAVKDTADQMFSGIELGQVQFTVLTSNQTRENDLESRRSALSPILVRQAGTSKNLNASVDLNAELDRTEKEVRDARTFIDILIAALNDAIPSDTTDAGDIAAFKAAASGARSSLTGTLSAITGARAGLETSKKGLEQGVTGAQSEDIAAAQAVAKQAEGAYNAALAMLEKTRIRTPISGSLNNLSIKTGDFVAPQQQVAVVSNNRALEILTYISESDRDTVVAGKNVLIEGKITGTITRVAPALDPVTRRIEVRVGIPADAALSSGQSVRLEIERGASEQIKAPTGPISVPISAVKIEATRTIVFTLDDGALTAHSVELGPLLGDKVQILSGIERDWYIVTDARGLKEGQAVVAK